MYVGCVRTFTTVDAHVLRKEYILLYTYIIYLFSVYYATTLLYRLAVHGCCTSQIH